MNTVTAQWNTRAALAELHQRQPGMIELRAILTAPAGTQDRLTAWTRYGVTKGEPGTLGNFYTSAQDLDALARNRADAKAYTRGRQLENSRFNVLCTLADLYHRPEHLARCRQIATARYAPRRSWRLAVLEALDDLNAPITGPDGMPGMIDTARQPADLASTAATQI
jgi:hypothetical protein